MEDSGTTFGLSNRLHVLGNQSLGNFKVLKLFIYS